METKDMIVLTDVSKQFKDQKVLKNIDLTIHQGEIFGLLGPSGAGKTTMIKLLMAMEKASGGNLVMMDEEVPNPKVFEQIGYMAQSDALYTDLTAEENMKFYCELYKIPKSNRKQRINDCLTIVNLQNDAKKIVSNYSGGMKRRLSLAICLLHEPKLLILDEPTVGMDPVLRQQIWDEFRILRDQLGVTILLTTHVMDEAEKCDRIAMIRGGHLIAKGSPDELLQTTQCNTLEEVFLKLGGDDNEN